eukprot:TRINITY_DN18041_c0_g1_i1.p1 TRINITY_DN18041_c0_g1~~TRINITY_DN18041_c0_g1_i1.p1  ORF type:complete len:507 (+),score=129.53 TRINITY_DN18041_c0_g1_i1:159-1679(+)
MPLLASALLDTCAAPSDDAPWSFGTARAIRAHAVGSIGSLGGGSGPLRRRHQPSLASFLLQQNRFASDSETTASSSAAPREVCSRMRSPEGVTCRTTRTTFFKSDMQKQLELEKEIKQIKRDSQPIKADPLVQAKQMKEERDAKKALEVESDFNEGRVEEMKEDAKEMSKEENRKEGGHHSPDEQMAKATGDAVKQKVVDVKDTLLGIEAASKGKTLPPQTPPIGDLLGQKGGASGALAQGMWKKGTKEMQKQLEAVIPKNFDIGEDDSDALPPEPIMEPGDVPSYDALGTNPAGRANVEVKVAQTQAEEAAKLATFAARAADAAAAESATAEIAAGDAEAAKAGALNETYSVSMAMSLNRYSKLAARSLASGEPAAPMESVRAMRVAKQAAAALQKAREQLALLEEFQEDENRSALGPKLSGIVNLIHKKLSDEAKVMQKIDDFAQRHQKQVLSMAVLPKEPPFIPPELLRRDGTPWWPEDPPPVELPGRMIMVKPLPGATAFFI